MQRTGGLVLCTMGAAALCAALRPRRAFIQDKTSLQIGHAHVQILDNAKAQLSTTVRVVPRRGGMPAFPAGEPAHPVPGNYSSEVDPNPIELLPDDDRLPQATRCMCSYR